MTASPKSIRIIGAGFSGLTCAYYLIQAGFRVEVIDRSNRSGGLLSTARTPYGLVESAANALLDSDRLESLTREIGIRLLRPKKESRRRYIFRGQPKRFPVGGKELFSFVGFILKMIFSRTSLRPKEGESLHEWGDRALGRKLSHFTIETALQGVYGGDPKDLSASLVLKNLFYKGPKVRGSRAPLGGMQELTEKLESYLRQKGVKFIFGQAIENFDFIDQPVVLAVPAYEAARILRQIDPRLSENLARVEYVPIIAAQIFFDLKHKALKGFGCLFAPEEGNLVLGVLMNHDIFENRAQNSISENWIMGGAFARDTQKFMALGDEEILGMALQKRNLFKTTNRESILGFKITRWPRAFPSYNIRLEKLLPQLFSTNKNVFLHGNYLGEIGLTRILERSALVAEQIRKKYV